MVSDNVVNPLEGMQQVCPKCKCTEVVLEVPETLNLKFKPAPSKENNTTATGNRYYRFKCGHCKLSTKNHTSASAACDEWMSFIQQYKGVT